MGQYLSGSLLLPLSGPLTATPLILFSYATNWATLSIEGILQYINLGLEFLFAALSFAELLHTSHAVAFPMIWVALMLYSSTSFYHSRSDR